MDNLARAFLSTPPNMTIPPAHGSKQEQLVQLIPILNQSISPFALMTQVSKLIFTGQSNEMI